MTLTSADVVFGIVGLINAIVLLLLKRGLSTLDAMAEDIGDLRERLGRFEERLVNIEKAQRDHREDDRAEFRDLWGAIENARPPRRPGEH